ncbi:hypothetical protein KC959_04470, partial [Candidatus Saccharibacteria bacterium]|nr:hypothetical protein [Candidatus Saccharibacteria bacterium]
MNLELTIMIFSSSVAFLAALFVFSRNYKKADNFYFSLLAGFISMYSVFNYLATTSENSEAAFGWAKMILISSVPQGVLLLFFASTIKSKKIIFNKRLQSLLLVWMVVIAVLGINGLIFKDVSVSDGLINIVPGPFVPFFALVHLCTILVGSKRLVSAYHRSKGRERSQLLFVTYGLLSSFVLTFLTTLVLPFLFKNTILLAVSPLFLTLSILMTAYAIIAHRLFDIKSAVTRTVTYVLSLLLVLFVYSSGIYALSTIFDLNSVDGTGGTVFYIGVAIISSFFLQPFKRLFDKITNKFFFRDSYYAQTFIDELNQTLVSNDNTDELLNKSCSL